MPRIRLLLPVLVAGAACLFAMPAAAVPLPRPAGDHQITTAHFVVHYYTDVSSSGPGDDYSSETQAGDVAAYAERAYTYVTGLGFPAPVNDGDGHVDIYLDDLTSLPGVIGYAEADGSFPFPSPDSGAITLATPKQMGTFATAEGLSLADEELKTIAHELFHLVQFATWVPNNASDAWLLEGSAQWVGFGAVGFPSGSAVTTVGPADIALNCRDSISGNQMCDPSPYVDGGYSRWGFYQSLANRFGSSFLQGVLTNGKNGQTSINALSNAIVAKGTTLGDVFTDYSNALMSGGFGVPALSSVRPSAHDSVNVGTATATLPTIKVPVDHLAVRYVTFQRGNGSSTSACYAASLTVNVTVPAGTSSRPYFFWDAAGSSPAPLNVNGSTATITVPWDTCNWGSAKAWLSLPNASLNVDSADFSVSASVTVDNTTPASATVAPSPTSIWGPTVPVPTADVPPAIEVFGPELIKVAAKDRQIRLIVQSSGPGMLQAALGSTALGNGALRAGNNDLRFAVPANLVASLRHASAAGANVLTLTPVSTSGAATGQAVTRVVSITAPPKKPKKPKHH